MKGNISLGKFIAEVKKELVEAAKNRDSKPFFTLQDVELETAFAVEAAGGTGIRFIVDLKGEAKASQTHRVKLKFKTIPEGASQNLEKTKGVGFETPYLVTEPFTPAGVSLGTPLIKINMPEGVNYSDPISKVFESGTLNLSISGLSGIGEVKK